MRTFFDIPYTNNPDDLRKLDITLPDCDEFPVFVYFHGGALEKGDRKGFKHIATRLADMNIASVSVEYRLYPDAKYPDFIEDAAMSVAWVKNNIGKYGKCSGIYVGGSSAGGYLSMMLCFDKKYYENVGVSPDDISGYLHDAGQPTAHYRVLHHSGYDSRRIIVDETAPIYHVGLQQQYPKMMFIVSDNDMKNRYEQTMLMLSTLKHFEYDMSKITLKVMHGTHCHYCNKSFDDGVAVSEMINELINQ